MSEPSPQPHPQSASSSVGSARVRIGGTPTHVHRERDGSRRARAAPRKASARSSGSRTGSWVSSAGLPIRHLLFDTRHSDRRHCGSQARRSVLAACCALWSLATAVCGMAFNFTSLIVGRALTAIGEAGGTPPSHSLISDYFSREDRATALSIYALGVPIGTMAGNLLGGWGNHFFGWRATFMLIGLPGLLVAGLVWFTVKEPPRGQSEIGTPHSTEKAPPLLDVVKFLASYASFRHMCLARPKNRALADHYRLWLAARVRSRSLARVARQNTQSTGFGRPCTAAHATNREPALEYRIFQYFIRLHGEAVALL